MNVISLKKQVVHDFRGEPILCAILKYGVWEILGDNLAIFVDGGLEKRVAMEHIRRVEKQVEIRYGSPLSVEIVTTPDEGASHY